MNKFGSILCQFSQLWSNYAKHDHFSAMGDFPYIFQYGLHRSAWKTKSFDNGETSKPILERRKIGLQLT